MIHRTFSYNDICQASANRQITETGTSIVKADTTLTYFITSIIGSSVTIKDAAGATMIVTNSISFNWPIRIDDGFDVSASGTVYLTYFTLG